jgi:hypothetical protein
MRIFVCLALVGLAAGACSYRSETVVQKPVPMASSSTTYVSPDSSSPTGTSTTTVYRN